MQSLLWKMKYPLLVFLYDTNVCRGRGREGGREGGRKGEGGREEGKKERGGKGSIKRTYKLVTCLQPSIGSHMTVKQVYGHTLKVLCYIAHLHAAYTYFTIQYTALATQNAMPQNTGR